MLHSRLTTLGLWVISITLVWLHQTHTFALSQEQTLTARKFHHWSVLVTTSGNKKRCHAVSFPMHTRGLETIRYSPYLALSYFRSGAFTLSSYIGLIIDSHISSQLTILDHNYFLNPYRDSFIQTSSSQDDVAITNHIIAGASQLSITSYRNRNELVVDYYSTVGLMPALKYIKNNCRSYEFS